MNFNKKWAFHKLWEALFFLLIFELYLKNKWYFILKRLPSIEIKSFGMATPSIIQY